MGDSVDMKKVRLGNGYIRFNLLLLCICLLLCGCSQIMDDDTQKTNQKEVQEEIDEHAKNVENTDNAEFEETIIEESRSYQLFCTEAPDYVYSAEKWIQGDVLHYPDDIEKRVNLQWNETMASYYVPTEAIEKASTISVLEVVASWPFSSYIFYNYPSDYIAYTRDMFNAADELWKRDNLAEIVLERYEQETFMPICPYEDKEREEEYKKEAYGVDRRIVLEELILASNEVFEQMDDEMRARTLKAVEEKISYRLDESYITSYSSSGFYAYVSELNKNGDSKWFTYIKENQEDSALIEKLSDFNSWSWSR